MKKLAAAFIALLTFTCATFSQDATPNLLKNKELFERSELFESVSVFADKDANEALIKDYESNPKAYKREQLLPVALCYLSFRNFEKTGLLLEEFLKVRPDNISATRTLATVRLMTKQNEAAKELLKKAYSMGDEASAILLASLYFMEKRPDEIGDIIGTIKRMAVTNLEALNLALFYGLRDKDKIDEGVIKEVLQDADPQKILANATPGGLADILRLYFVTRNYWPVEKLIIPARAAVLSEAWVIALDTYKKVLENDPKNPIALRGMGLVSYRTGDISGADEYITKAYDAGDSDAVIDGLELFILSKRAKMWEKYSKAAQGKPLPPQLCAALVQFSVRQGDNPDIFFFALDNKNSDILYSDPDVRALIEDGLKKFSADKRAVSVSAKLKSTK